MKGPLFSDSTASPALRSLPLFRRLADEYTMSDNYHQPVMGGTAVQHTMLMTGDALFWDQDGSLPAQPPPSSVADPTPGYAELPFTPTGLKDWQSYDPANGDYTGSCLPYGL